ncbi:hypothetical protein LPTSP4_16850 [Leptospira ryugenii]|uniref:Uncharacterized protein n=1 Tax=Leptospira ryugenii TaxID=1917863 RepID=A0A2P2DZV2_9LEPT|nr:hypothetical protein [Leptospira ryugenii]GBF50161.1 hypothetical protein LPTSP4_16850 [Leptospira ryugenii]
MIWKYKIKKPESGTSLSWEIYFPPGLHTFGSQLLTEKLSQFFLPNQIKPNIRIFKEKVKLEQTSAHYITFLYETCFWIRDIRLILAKLDFSDDPDFQWETANERIPGLVSPMIESLFPKRNQKFYSDIKSKLSIYYFEKEATVGLSLFGDPSYLRGLKESFSSSAPISEDFACSFFEFLDHTFPTKTQLPSSLLVPFIGTGTFGTEFFLRERQTIRSELPKKFLFPEMSIYPAKTKDFILKKRNHLSSTLSTQIWYDTDPAILTYLKKEKKNWEKHWATSIPWHIETKDFFKLSFESLVPLLRKDLEQTEIRILLPLNPPYGLRKQGVGAPNSQIYEMIGKQVKLLQKECQNLHLNAKIEILGFILCASEEQWSKLMREWKDWNLKTIHVTHGGIDLRVLFFQSVVKDE